MADTGETSAVITARGDDRSWPLVLKELQAGATLKRIPKLRRSYADMGAGPFGSGISDARVRKLERTGVIRHVGIDRYALNDQAADDDDRADLEPWQS